MEEIFERVAQLKAEKNAVILAHYYVNGDVQQVADYIGDSYYLSKVATTLSEKVIVFAGVNFMADSAKVLNPDKKVILPDSTADCPMAHMVTTAQIKKVRELYEDVAVVCYINSTLELKAESDVCVTSANAVKVVKALPNKNIFFIPDKNLAHFVAEQIPEKHFIYNEGYCPVHNYMAVKYVEEIKEKYPDIKILAHPECPRQVLAQADYIGSTSGIIDFAKASKDTKFLICTENGVGHKLQLDNPDKMFIFNDLSICQDMKKITLQSVIKSLESLAPEVEIDLELGKKALKPLEKMLELAK